MFGAKKKFKEPEMDIYNGPWVTDIKGVKVGQYGAGYYDFAEFSIGNHTILIEACNGYHISVDVPDWFEPSTDSWPQIIVTKRWKVMDVINIIINYINEKEGTNYKLEFKDEKKAK